MFPREKIERDSRTIGALVGLAFVGIAILAWLIHEVETPEAVWEFPVTFLYMIVICAGLFLLGLQARKVYVRYALDKRKKRIQEWIDTPKGFRRPLEKLPLKELDELGKVYAWAFQDLGFSEGLWRLKSEMLFLLGKVEECEISHKTITVAYRPETAGMMVVEVGKEVVAICDGKYGTARPGSWLWDLDDLFVKWQKGEVEIPRKQEEEARKRKILFLRGSGAPMEVGKRKRKNNSTR